MNRRPRRLGASGKSWLLSVVRDRTAASGGHAVAARWCHQRLATRRCARICASLSAEERNMHFEGCRSDLLSPYCDGFPRSTGDWRPFAYFPVALSTRSSRWH